MKQGLIILMKAGILGFIPLLVAAQMMHGGQMMGGQSMMG